MPIGYAKSAVVVHCSCVENGDAQDMKLPVEINKAEITAFCKKHHITKLALFGSVLTDRFGPESDVDVLIEFDQEHIPGLFALSGMEFELTDILGRKADMRTKGDLSRFFRNEVVKNAKVQYVV